MVHCQDGHHYKKDDLFPLQRVNLEGIPVLVPRGFKLVQAEYSAKAPTRNRFHWYCRIEDRNIDLPLTPPRRRFNYAVRQWKPD